MRLGEVHREKSMLLDLIGTIGSLILCVSALPQIVKTYRTKSAGDISIVHLLTLFLGIILTTIYSFSTGDPVLIFGGSLSVVCTGILILLSFLYRERSYEELDQGSK
ncbi:MAG: PQ-loop repeat-containing protein [Desulfobacteraceae bacterium]|nr:MAG: PQ-loop repeat-containing protein [Desulfobacteraceae bacterium]